MSTLDQILMLLKYGGAFGAAVYGVFELIVHREPKPVIRIAETEHPTKPE